MDMVKYCEFCGVKLVEKTFPSGRKAPPSYYQRRRYCKALCARRARAGQTGCSAEGGRKRAQRQFTPTACENCAIRKDLVRHHRDGDTLNNMKANISFLCRSCHTKLEWKAGRYANRPKPQPIRDAITGRFLAMSASAPTAPDTEPSATQSPSPSSNGSENE